MRNTLTIEFLQSIVEKEEYTKMGVKTTICLLTLENGFEVVGYSACVDPSNFNEEIGRKLAKVNAINKLWELEGYVLHTKL